MRFPARPSIFTPLLLALLPLSGIDARTFPESERARVPVEVLRLDNGLQLLIVQQPESTTVSAGWMVRCGSADDPVDHTGMSHLLEHMLFKGSRTIGTRHPEREATLLAEIDRVHRAERALGGEMPETEKRRRRLARRLSELADERQTLERQIAELQMLGEFSFLYSQHGGTGLNANTYRDMTVYYVTLPSEKLELWFWLESDRLVDPVFRQLYREISVIAEERRLRIDSTPTGAIEEELRELFWGADHPYAWNPLGRPGDLESVTREEARAFFSNCYGANRMTAALVGNVDPQRIESLARRYFARLPASHPIAPLPPPSPSTNRSTQSPTQRLEASCNCATQMYALYPSAPFETADSYALELLAAVLNGRSGRLYRRLVLERGIAFSAFVRQTSWRLAGEFRFQAETKGGSEPEDLLAAWDLEVERLRLELVSDEELRRSRNRMLADAFRLLKDPLGLMRQLLIYQGLGDWRYLNDWSEEITRVTSTDIRRAANRYLTPKARSVALIRGRERPPETPAYEAADDEGSGP